MGKGFDARSLIRAHADNDRGDDASPKTRRVRVSVAKCGVPVTRTRIIMIILNPPAHIFHAPGRRTRQMCCVSGVARDRFSILPTVRRENCKKHVDMIF